MSKTPPGQADPSADISIFTRFAIGLFKALTFLSLQKLLDKAFPVLKPHADLTDEELHSDKHVRTRAKAVEFYILGWLIFEIILVCVVCAAPISIIWRVIIDGIVILRIVEIFQVAVNISVFNRMTGRPDHRVYSSTRLLVLSFINFMELSLCFGIAYASDFHRLHGAGQPITGFYLSIITQLTIGYGDVYPTGYLRIFAASQGIISLVFVVLIFGRFVASLPQIYSNLDLPVKKDSDE